MNSTLYLCNNVELDPKYNYTIDFETIESQASYFNSKVSNVIPSNNYSYIRDNRYITVAKNYDELFGVNYLFYTNNNKRYYAFITSKEYVSDTTTRLIFDIDIMQTFMFDYELNESFIDREHQDRFKPNGEIILNTVDEGLDYGSIYDIQSKPIIINNQFYDQTNEKLGYLYVYSTKSLTSDTLLKLPSIDRGVPLGLYIYFVPVVLPIKSDATKYKFKFYNGVDNPEEIASLEDLYALFSNESVYQILFSRIPPIKLDISIDESTHEVSLIQPATNLATIKYAKLTGTEFKILEIRERYEGVISIDPSISFRPRKPQFITDTVSEAYEPKLWLYPYMFNKLSVGSNEITIKNENSTYFITGNDNSTIKIDCNQSLSEEGGSLYRLKNYGADGGASKPCFDYTLVQQIPYLMNLSSNAWKQYMLQNKSQRTAGFVTDALTGIGATAVAIGGGIASKNPLAILAGVGVGVNSVAKIGGQLAKESDIKNQPDNIKQFSGDLGVSLEASELSIIKKSYDILPEYKTKIFNYLNHYGYKCNNFKKPNLKSRFYFNYIKTVGCTIKSNLDMEYRDRITDIYDNGITIWHYRGANTFKGVNNYDYENLEMTLYKGGNTNEQ